MTDQSEVRVTTSPEQRRARPAWLGPALLAVLAGLLVFGLMRLTWPAPAGTQLQRRLLQLSDLLLALVSAGLVGALVTSVLRARDARIQDPVSVWHRSRLFLLMWVVFTVPLVLWWVGEWPGHYYSDVRASLRASSDYRVDAWLSSFWGIWAHGLHRATGSYPILALVNVVILGALLADFFSLLWHLGLSRRVGGLFTVLVVTSVPVGLLVICLSHDILNGLLRLAIALVLLRVLVRRALTGQSGVTPLTLPTLAVLTAVATLLRGDSMALLLYVPGILLLTRQVRVGAALVLLVAIVGGNQFYRRVIERRVWPELGELPARYGVSLLLNPVGFMIQNGYLTRTPEEDRAALNDVVDYQCMVEHYRLTEPGCYWTTLKPPITQEKLKALQGFFLRSVRDNPGLYLSNRLATFAGTLGMDPRILWPFQYRREQYLPEHLYGAGDVPFLASQGLLPARAPQAVARVTHWLRDASFPSEGGRFFYFPWNGVPALLLTLWLVSRWRTLPVSAAVAGAIAAPAALVFLAAPASHPTYVADLWVFGYLAVPLAWFEYKVLRARRVPAGSAS